MLIDTSVTIAYKCTSCGSYEFFGISLFKFLYKAQCRLSCRCKKSWISVKQEGESNFLISIPCIGCGNEHTYLYTKKNILSGEAVVFNCPETGLQICFIGRDEIVRKKVDSLEKEFDELIDMYGYESYFHNTQVMFDALNRIHDIALSGNLYCECGSTDIDLVLLSERILLRCGKCGGSKSIPAAKNTDLKDILMKSQILITDGVVNYGLKNDDFASRKSGNKFGK